MVNRRRFLKCACTIVLAPQSASAQARWELRFLRVWQSVQVRVGGAGGPLILLANHSGDTWTDRDANPSPSLDISKWVGNAPEVRLYARVTCSRGSPACVMQTLYGGVEKQRWSFDSEATYEIRR